MECLFSRILCSNVKELPIAATADLNLKTIMLPERSSTDKTVLFHLYEILEKGNRIYHNRKKINDHLDLRVGGSNGRKRSMRTLGEYWKYWLWLRLHNVHVFLSSSYCILKIVKFYLFNKPYFFAKRENSSNHTLKVGALFFYVNCDSSWAFKMEISIYCTVHIFVGH